MSQLRVDLRRGIVDRRAATWQHQDWLSVPRSVTRYPERWVKGTSYLRWIKHTWATRADHYWQLRASSLRDFKVVDGNQAWEKSVLEVQRAYPGTQAWLLSCSASEGGWGRWVPNSQGSGVGGWLQFMPGTFAGFVRHAIEDVRARGFRVPESAWSWYSTLGQALAGGWGITHGMRHHWSGSGCQ